MVHEYEVLTHLSKNEITTQRQISRDTGLSLGTVNLLLKKMVRNSLVKIERLNARTMRYILTPQGMEEKTRLAYRYVRDSPFRANRRRGRQGHSLRPGGRNPGNSNPVSKR